MCNVYAVYYFDNNRYTCTAALINRYIAEFSPPSTHILFILSVKYLFQSCMHLPYLTLLKKFGLEIQLFRIKWFTTAFNRMLMKWGMSRSKFWSVWYNAGLISTIVLLPISIIVILKMTFYIWLYNSASPNEKKEQVLELMVS